MKVQWTDRTGAIEFIRQQMSQGKSFHTAFLEMRKVAKNMGFIRKSTTFEIMSSGTYTKLRNDCRREHNEGA